jgi:hypothetical protein
MIPYLFFLLAILSSLSWPFVNRRSIKRLHERHSFSMPNHTGSKLLGDMTGVPPNEQLLHKVQKSSMLIFLM